jgi:acid phosphatase type 7
MTRCRDGRRHGPVALVLASSVAMLTVAVGASAAQSAGFVPRAPARLADTRPRGETIDGIDQAMGPLEPGRVLDVVVARRAAVPKGAKAAALTFTVTDPVAPGFLTVWPCGTPKPTASLSNFASGQIVAATTMIGLGPEGNVCAALSTRGNLIVDLAGHQPADSTYVGVSPARLLDTRTAGATLDGLQSGTGPVAARSSTKVVVRGRGGVTTDASSAYLTVTAIALRDDGFVTVYRCGQPVPNVSTVNVSAGRVAANSTIVLVSEEDTCLYASASVHLLVDVSGYEPAFSTVRSDLSTRAFDSRSFGFVGQTMIPLRVPAEAAPTDRSSVAINVTAVDPQGDGFLTIYPDDGTGCQQTAPTASVLNFVKGQTVANFAIVGVSRSAAVCVFGSVATYLIVDIVALIASDALPMVRLVPIADATLDGAAPTENDGKGAFLVADAVPLRESVLQFYLGIESESFGAIRTAKLRLHVAETTASIPDPGSVSAGTVSSMADSSWDERSVTFANRPTTGRTLAATLGVVAADHWVELDVTAVVRNSPTRTPSFVLNSVSADGVYYSSRESAFPPELVVVRDDANAGETIAAVGDMVCESSISPTANSCQQQAVADRIAGDHSISTFLSLGDLQYQVGALAEFNMAYNASYGQLNAKVKPVPGNHEYGTPNAAGYFSYFGSRAGDPTKGYYTFTQGSWRFLALNTNLSCTVISCSAGSAQEQFVRSTLATDKVAGRVCSLAYWHHPRFASDTSHGNNTDMQALWSAMNDYGVDAVLNGHVHTYERFDQLNTAGAPSADGVREFIIGTGGVGHYTNGPPKPGSVVRIETEFGYTRFQLFSNGYSWDFINDKGQILDSGTAPCNV